MNKHFIRFITYVSIFLCTVLIIGLSWAVNEYYASANPKKVQSVQTSMKEPVKKKGLTVVALGDSLTRGTGDVTGKGYVGDVMDEIKKRTKQKVTLLNLGINGQRSDQLKKQVVQKEVQRQLKSADIVLLTIGGNDLFQGGQGLFDFQKVNFGMVEKKYLVNLKTILTQIRTVNQNANVFFVGLYNPFINLNEGKDISKIIRKWNYDSAEVSATYPKVVFVPTFDLFELKVNDYLYSDKFHPNSKGYRLIAERVAALLTW